MELSLNKTRIQLLNRFKLFKKIHLCEIYDHGATVTSWKVDGKEKLFLSSKAVLDGSKAIRGGIPVVFPNFGPWAHGPQHGFARILPWNVAHQTESSVTFSLEPCKKSREMWDFSFKVEYTGNLPDPVHKVNLI